MTLSTGTILVVLALVLLGAALGAWLGVLWWRRREAARERALGARLSERPAAWDCLECGAQYRAAELFCKACGAWPGQTG